MKWLIPILILAIVLIAGCTQQLSNAPIGNSVITDFSEIVKNPENYQNKTITIQGRLASTLLDSLSLQDDQGYNILIYGSYFDYHGLGPIGNCKEENRQYEIGKYYKATGTINVKIWTNNYNENKTTYIFECKESIVKIS